MQELFAKIGFSLTFDTAIIVFLVIAAFFYGVSIGRRRVMIMLIATYIAYAIYIVVPYLDRIEVDKSTIAFIRIGIFAGLVIACYLLLSGTKVGELFHFTKMQGIKHWWQIFIMGVLQIGLWVSIFLTLFSEKVSLKIAPITDLLFTKDAALFIWFVAPVIFLSFFRKKKERQAYEERGE